MSCIDGIIVHFKKIPFYYAFNTLNNFCHINIYSPSEVIRYEEDILLRKSEASWLGTKKIFGSTK
jgi:hypothetical protein